MPAVTIPGVGRVNFPDSMSVVDVQAASAKLSGRVGIDPKTGKTLWSGALPKHRNNYYSSPLIAGGNFYAIREDGAAFVAKVNDKFELLAENNMSERVIASPVAVAGRLLIRGEQHLFCIGSAGQ